MKNVDTLNFEVISGISNHHNVFISGFTANLDAFRPIAEQLKSNAILVDNLGAGKSPQPQKSYTTDEMADQVIAVIESVTDNPVNIMGHSMGGAIAQKIALKKPDLINTLFLISSFAKADTVCIKFLQYREMLVNACMDKEMIANAVMPSIFANDFLSNPKNIDTIIERFKNNTQTLPGLSGQLRAIETHDTVNELREIKIPTKIITGINDVLVSPGHSHFLHSNIPSSSIFEIDHCGHMVQMEKGNQLLTILKQ